MAPDLPRLVVTDADAWRSWLDAHHARSAGVWLLLAKRSDTRARRINQFVAMLARDETIHAQRRTPTQ